MAAISEEYISSLLQKVTSAHSVQTWRYTLEKFETVGQNYFGIILPVVLYGERDGKNVQIEIVLKLAPTDERYRISGAVTLMFSREIYVYDTLLNTYQKVQDNFPANLQYVIPRCYYLQKEYCKEAIVMQNMYAEGFRPYSHEMFLDVDHIIIALKSLAKLHGLSFLLEYKHPELYNDISKVCVPLTEESGKRYMEIMKDRLNKAIKKFEGTEYVPLLQRLNHNCSTFFKLGATSVQRTCICHGDIWKENILYRYEDNKPATACLIDYQNTRISCSAYDTLYLILSSTNTDVRRKHYYQLLDIYYDTFQEMLKEGGLESEQVYSRQMLDHDLKVIAPACVITANCALWLSSGLQEEGHVRSKITWSTPEEKDKAVNKYRQIVRSIIDDCCNYGYISLNCDDH
ncbi:unnamed protein product [Arctia plantaginis]|uniref:CHK kinase-like domain-containing protein n=1 Tax=Arctia plantaginis TaxID=874455 RepID=A0A8S0ZIW4_ARCPL|nr:unnamed protein product [Arctia plantaginis]CAB3238433.1 unnamed protein product [Arctia plantaginis]